MQYYVSVNERELKALLLMLERMELEKVIVVDNTFSYDEELIYSMAKKKYLKKKDEGYQWNPFVKMILYSVIHAESVMFQRQKDGSICNFYYWKESAVMLVKASAESQYVFFLVSLIPKMVGGMASYYENFEHLMPDVQETVQRELYLKKNTPNLDSLQHALTENQCVLPEDEIQIWFEAFQDEIPVYAAVLIKNDQNQYILAECCDGSIVLTKVDYCSMIQHVSRKMIKLHGNSINNRTRGVRNVGVSDNSIQSF